VIVTNSLQYPDTRAEIAATLSKMLEIVRRLPRR
jgi:hypothetical protein